MADYNDKSMGEKVWQTIVQTTTGKTVGQQDAIKEARNSAKERLYDREYTKELAKQRHGEGTKEYNDFIAKYDKAQSESEIAELEAKLHAAEQKTEDLATQKAAAARHKGTRQEAATKGTDATAGDGKKLVDDNASEEIKSKEFQDSESALEGRANTEMGKTAGQQFLNDKDKNENYEEGSSAEKVQNEIENANADEVRETANDAVMKSLDEYKKNSQLDDKSLEKSKKYAENIGNNLYTAYKSGSFGEPGSKDAKAKFATLLTNHIGTMLYNIGSDIKGSGTHAQSDFQKMKDSDLSAAMERKNKADEQELEKNIRDQFETEEDFKAAKDAVNKLQQDEVFGAYTAKMDAKQKIWAAEAQAQYGKFFQDNPQVAGHIAAAVTSGNPEYISKTIDAVDQMKNMSAEEALSLKQDIVRNLIEQATSRGIKSDEALYDYLVRFDIANKIGINNAKQLTEFGIEQERGTFGGRLRRGVEKKAGEVANKAVDAGLAYATGGAIH